MTDAKNGIKQITHQEAIAIIIDRKPKGLFYENDGGVFVGIDNSTGDAWVEEFESLADCIKWLAGE